MGEPGGLPSMGSHRVKHDWSDLAAAAERFYKINLNRKIPHKVGWKIACQDLVKDLLIKGSSVSFASSEKLTAVLWAKVCPPRCFFSSKLPFGQRFSKCGPRTRSNSITWELVRNVNSQFQFKLSESEILQGSQNPELLTKASRGFWCTLQFKSLTIMEWNLRNMQPSLAKWSISPYPSKTFPNISAFLKGI